ncbi:MULTISPECIES: YbaK/EbsC family protein [unclassified Streptomyces]|uniref:YbaK/EbsC family protein n=1 Tax=unclassified Streptomyces TaxID=2593676 RepID=UPI00367C1EA1
MAERLLFQSVGDRLDLVADPVREVIQEWRNAEWIGEVRVAEIDPVHAGGADLCEYYGLDIRTGGNCVLVKSKRGSQVRKASCLVPVATRADLNGLVKRTLGARQVSLMAREDAVAESRMEYGSITVIGLPEEWPVLVDSTLAEAKEVIIGSGRVNAKLQLPGVALVAMSKAIVLEGLGSPATTP